ncbi:MAG TPA: multidrug transporter, partial [Hyphomonadaceae bacterium]|nr:multidrug transporter [Hyphomonadaceae bacterium]
MTPPFRQAALAAAMAVVPAALVAPSQAQAPIYGAPQAQQASPPRPADSAPAPLTPETVLDASSASAPDILARLAEIRAAQGGALSAQGAFDVIFSADGFSRVTGFWDGSILNTDVRRNIGAFNGT